MSSTQHDSASEWNDHSSANGDEAGGGAVGDGERTEQGASGSRAAASVDNGMPKSFHTLHRERVEAERRGELVRPPPTNPAPRASSRSGSAPPVEYQFRKGESGNARGRPRGSSLLTPLLRKLAANPDLHGDGALARQQVELLLAALAGGDARTAEAILRLMDRTDGPVRQELHHTGTIEQVRVRLEDPEQVLPAPIAAAIETPRVAAQNEPRQWNDSNEIDSLVPHTPSPSDPTPTQPATEDPPAPESSPDPLA